MNFFSTETGRSDGDNNPSEREAGDDENSSTSSLLIVILSLVFVVVFGCALVGGVLSGDPTNGFFITIVVASALAVAVAAGVSIRYIYINRFRDDDSDNQGLSKEDVRGTFSNSEEDDEYDEEYANRYAHNQTREDHFPNRNPIATQIKEIQAKSVVGEMSALSPQSYDGDSLSALRHHIIQDQYKLGRQGFDFTSITSNQNNENNRREDPPEGLRVQPNWIARGASKDPSARKFSTDGEIILDDEDEVNNEADDVDEEMNKSIVSRKSARSRSNDVEDSSQKEKDANTIKTEKKSSSASRTAKSPSSKSEVNVSQSKRKQKRTVSAIVLISDTTCSNDSKLTKQYFIMFSKTESHRDQTSF